MTEMFESKLIKDTSFLLILVFIQTIYCKEKPPLQQTIQDLRLTGEYRLTNLQFITKYILIKYILIYNMV